MIRARVHRGIEATLAQVFPLEYIQSHWEEHRVGPAGGDAIVILLKEYHVYRRHDFPEEEYWAFATGLYRVLLGGTYHAGNRAFCVSKLAEYRRTNPHGLSDALLALVDEFLKTKEATDGTKSIPPPRDGD